MINREATIRWKGYDPDDLKPKSGKRVWAVCEACGKGRWIRKSGYSDLCFMCSLTSDEKRQKMREVTSGENHPLYGKHPSEETCKKRSESMRGEKHHMFGKHHSEETRKKMSEAKLGERHHMYGKHPSEETRKKMSEASRGEKGSNWKGGVSFGQYCPKFNDAFKESIRDKFDRTCFLCPTTEKEQMDDMRSRGKIPSRLSVHHVNYNKDCLCDDSDCEFVPLCIQCHAKTNSDREYWENMIMEEIQAMSDFGAIL